MDQATDISIPRATSLMWLKKQNTSCDAGHLASFRTRRQTTRLLSDSHAMVCLTSVHELKTFHTGRTARSHFTYRTQTWHMSPLKPWTHTGQTTHAVLITVPSCQRCTWVSWQLVFWCDYYSPMSPWSFRSNSAYLSAKQTHTQEIITHSGNFVLSSHTPHPLLGQYFNKHQSPAGILHVSKTLNTHTLSGDLAVLRSADSWQGKTKDTNSW